MTRVDYWDDPDVPRPNSIVPSATTVVVRDQRLLMIHRVDNDRWALPGGAIDKLEHLNVHPSMRIRIEHGLAWAPGDPAHIG